MPLTTGTVAQIFGTRHLSSLYGIVFLSHQVGSFLGVWLGGRVYDATGSYDPVWIIAIVLGVAAAIVHLPIKDQALVRDGRLQEAPVPELTQLGILQPAAFDAWICDEAAECAAVQVAVRR